MLEPLGLGLKAGSGTPRIYRLSRVLAASALPQSFERPDGFDLALHWDDYEREYEARLFRSSATIRLSERGRALLFLGGSVASRAGHAAMQPAAEDGWATTTIPIESV